MKSEIFKGVVQWPMEKDGHSGNLPCFYYDNTSISATFTASTSKVRELLPNPQMHPVEIAPGRCLVVFTAFEYRHTDIGPYNEFSIAFLITFGHKPVPLATMLNQLRQKCFSAYVWQLPVTTEIARYAGVELYGFPKYIANIDFKRDKDFIECTLTENDHMILVLKGKTLPTAPGGMVKYRAYSIMNGVPLKANVVTSMLEFAQTMNRDSSQLELGTEHPVSKKLRELDLSSKPTVYQYSPQNESILFGGRNLMDD